MCLLNLARAEFPEPKSATILRLSPRAQFSKNLPQFWDFHEYKLSLLFLLRRGRKFITTFLGTFVLRFRYVEFTACVYCSFEFYVAQHAWRSKPQNVMPTDISSLLVVPLTLHWKGR